MPFVLQDLVIESVLRDGFENARANPEVINDVFGNLTRSYAMKKYGEPEIAKIKNMVINKEVSIVHSYHMVDANMPCISIQLLGDTEDEAKSHFSDHIGYYDIPMTSQQDLDALIIVPAFEPISYNAKTGILRIPNSVDLSSVYANLLFIDADGNEYPILGSINNQPDSKTIGIQKEADVVLGVGCLIKSSINFRRYEAKGNVEKCQILLGVHTRDPLTTKYLYTLVKYFMLSRKNDLIKRDFQLATYNGSDFHRNNDYVGDAIFSRFLTVSGTLQHDWRSDLVKLIDSVQVDVLVEADRLGNQDLKREEQTIKLTKD